MRLFMIFTKDKKNGFTIVELVICIAVIGILSAILIPTFSGLISDAKETAKQTALSNAYTEYVSKNADSGLFFEKDSIYISYEEKLYCFENGRYVVLKNDNNEIVTQANAENSGYILFDYKCNNLNVYYKQSNFIIDTNEDDTNQENTDISNNELQENLILAWNEAKEDLGYTDDEQRDIMFAKESEQKGYYEVYAYSSGSNYELYITETIEILETDYTINTDTTYNGYYVVTI